MSRKLRDITKEDLEKHNTSTNCWVVLQGYVYDVTTYLNRHPGGPKCIAREAGGDITASYMRAHAYLNPAIIERLKIGRYVG